MTKNQIEYAKLLETKRYNDSMVELSRMRNENEINLGYAQLREQSRHNLVGESLDTRKTSESIRHNKSLEEIQNASLFESKRHSLELEKLQGLSVSEAARHNLQSESETMRSNVRRESLAAQQLSWDMNQFNQQMTYNYANLSENIRYHNVSADLEKQSIAQRSQAVQMQVGLGYSQLSEASRHNMAQESISTRATDETVRSNLSRERETREHNAQMELLETQRVQETIRHNKEVEQQDSGVKLGRTLESGTRIVESIAGLAPTFFKLGG